MTIGAAARQNKLNDVQAVQTQINLQGEGEGFDQNFALGSMTSLGVCPHADIKES